MDDLEDQFTTHQACVYRFLLRLCSSTDLAAELTQETLARGWQRREQIRNLQATRTWLLRIAHNRFCEYLRKNDRQRSLGWEPLEEGNVPGNESTPERLTSDQELGQQIWQAMSDLPPRQCQVLHLHVVDQLSVGEIAEVLEINNQAVRSNLSAARNRMRQLLSGVDSLPNSQKTSQ